MLLPCSRLFRRTSFGRVNLNVDNHGRGGATTITHPMQLPLSLLKTAQGQPMLVELKNGDTYNGRLDNCDSWMNIKLKDVIFTSRVRSRKQNTPKFPFLD